MSYPQPASDHLEIRTTNNVITLEELDLRNRKFHHLHDEVIAAKVTHLLRKAFSKDEYEQLS